MYNIAILASGNGSNAENIARLFNQGNKIKISLVISNREKAKVHQRMESLGVPTITIPNVMWDNEPMQVVETLKKYNIDLVVLAGFMHKIEPEIIHAYEGRMINIHPSLLPAYGGKGMWGHHVHEAVIANKEKKSGVTVHYVSEEIDGGEILMQQSIDLEEGETAETLEEKIHKIEYDLYPRAIVAAVDRLKNAGSNSSEQASMSQDSERQKAEAPSKTNNSVDVDEAWANDLKIKFDREKAEEIQRQQCQSSQPDSGQSMPNPIPRMNNYGGRASIQPNEPMPPTYLVWAVLATVLCCFIPGIVAIVYSTQVSSRYYAGDMEGAKRASKRVEIWVIVSFVLGVLSATVIQPIMMLKGLI